MPEVPQDTKPANMDSSQPVKDVTADAVVAEVKDALATPPPKADAPTVYSAADPLTALRDQALALVNEENRSQLASLIRAIGDHYGVKPNKSDDEPSRRVRDRYAHLAFTPREVHGGQQQPDLDWVKMLSANKDNPEHGAK